MTVYFTGTFDPPTIGHLDIIKRAALNFEKVVVLMLVNPEKKAMFSVDDRLNMLNALTADLKNVSVDFSNLFATDYVLSHGGGILLRGIRSEADLNYENLMAKYNLNHGVDTIFMFADEKLKDVSSSKFKEFLSYSILPEAVKNIIKNIVK